MSSSVKAIFPSISISKKKGKTTSGGTPQTSNAQSQPFLRPLTPESNRKPQQTASNPIDPLRSALTARGPSPIPSPSTARRTTTGEGNPSALENGSQLSQSTPDLRLGFRHVRSISQPSGLSTTSHRESFSSVTFPDRSNSVNSDTGCYTETAEEPMILQEDIIALTCHVRNFSDALSSLRNTFIECEDNPDSDPPQLLAHERLGEVLSVLKGVLNTYQPLHSTDILASAGTLISKVKSHNYEDTSKPPDEFYESIDQLALAFSSSVSDFLMGEQDIGPSEQSMNKHYSQSLEDFGDDDDEDMDEKGYEEDYEDDQDYLEDEGKPLEKKESVDTSAEKADELDRALIMLEHGVDIAMQRTKIWAKYSKDIETYVDKRAHLELEYTNKLAKLAQTTRAAIKEENYLPFQSIYVTALDKDIDYAESANKTYAALLASRFMEPLTARRLKHEKIRKDLKDSWAKSCKKLTEAAANLKKAKSLYIQKQQELEKEESTFSRGAKKKEGDIKKADEAEEMYKSWVAEANARQRELENTKANILVELRQLVYQCDMTMKAVTCNYFQMMNALVSPGPIQFQTLAESSRNYEPGNQFAEFVRLQQANSPQAVEQVFQFEPYSAGYPDRGPQTPSRHNSLFDSRNIHIHSAMEETAKISSPFTPRRNKSLQLHNVQSVNSSQQPINAWSNLKEHNSDGDSTTSRSLPGSPSGSPTSDRKAKIPRAQSLEFISSDDAENKDERRSTNGPVNPGSNRRRKPKERPSAGPFQNIRLSASAKTHTLKKLRSASKCRECDSYVYFNGAECEVCGLTCHKKCLKELNIRCGKLSNGQRRMTTFGVDFNSHLRHSATEEENIPHIISSCIDEIDNRGLDVKGIYRVSGVKSRVEKLCQSFENGEYQADLSDTPPHVIAAVLKLYLRQLPESLLTVKLYPEFIRVAKESFAIIDNSTTCKAASENEDIQEEYQSLTRRLREVVMQLPTANRVTAARLIKHLRRVSDHDEANAMPGSKLAIVFGPTLLRPSENEVTTTLSSLVDMPHQTRLVELLIASPEVFEYPEADDSISRERPVEKFSPPKPLEREGSLVVIQSMRSAGNNPDDSYEAGDEERAINASQPKTINIPPSPSPSTRSSLGFGSEFFDLLARSNNRSEELNDRAHYSIPEFLLSDSPRERVAIPREDSDMEDEYEDDTTQGTSGSRTPDDDLDSSHFSAARRVGSPRSSNENLADDDKVNSIREPSFSVISRSSLSYSFAPSFTSDVTNSLLPDPSDSVGSDKINTSRGVGIPFNETRIFNGQYDFRNRSSSGNTAEETRPRTFVKRNSDLPGRAGNVADYSKVFYPIGMKQSASYSNLHKDPNSIEEEVSLRAISEVASSSSNTVTSSKSDILDRDDLAEGDDHTYLVNQSVAVIDVDFKGALLPEGVGDSSVIGSTASAVSPVQSSIKGKAESKVVASSLTPPQSPAQSPSSEYKDFDVSLTTSADKPASVPEIPSETGPRELIIPVMTALQERRSPTPNSPTAEESSESQSSDRAETPVDATPEKKAVSVVDDKKPEMKGKPRSTYTTRVSVKDRLQQYERNRSASVDSNRKTSSELFSPNTVASRKQRFEQRERGVYKRVSDMTTGKPRSDSGGSGSGSASGSPKLSRKYLNDTDDGDKNKLVNDKQCEPRLRNRKERSENTDSPRNLILDKLDRQRESEDDSFKLDLNDGATLSPREIDFPIDSLGAADKNRSERTRRSPSNSPRSSRTSTRSSFPDDSKEEDREPQFV
ncbi:rho GTPase-activating protein 45-like isoform X2 [Stylophora pistillata]|uniref:rho GTPase-activating protein 45-like isoform X2 n=1 Tax=Stylophora pistillata TaxID=50429 RepID=UPI000C03D81D|nr:rho GTPase-activating protein 45-like isoform X2 [Stylophora pistillata]